jgi:succinate-semialdehyde dehydrogenase/glutarate-semialdehyde dehydrogenase
VDPDFAAEQVAESAFAGAGQSCGSVERVHVHRAVAEPFLAALVERARTLRIGPGLASGTDLGPLIDADQRLWVHRQVQDAVYEGAELRAGGEPLYGPGFFYPPTVLVGAPDDALVICGETRGPVVTVQPVDSFDEGLIGGERIGIASVLTPVHANARRAWRLLPARTVSVNEVFRARPGGDPELLDAVTRTKVVHLA